MHAAFFSALESQVSHIYYPWERGIIEIFECAQSASHFPTSVPDIALACYCHFRTTYNQIRWVQRRNDPVILQEERALAETMLQLLRRDSRLGYEASNHYLYTENDFLEKIINCEFLLQHLSSK